MKKYIPIAVLFFGQLYSQGPTLTPNQPVSLPLNPEAYSLLKFDINPVDLNTGIPDISENLYSVKADPHINIDLNLKYHPSGIRIKELSGLVGQGWNLNASGAVTREINGLPDDKPVYGILDNGFENAVSQYGMSHNETVKYLYDSKYGKQDVEYDLFHFNFLNHSGSFKLNQNGIAEYVGRGGNYKISYERTQDNDKRISKIIIVDDSGYKYIFDKKTTDGRTTTKNLIYENMHDCLSYTPMESTMLPVPYTTWYLSEIQNPDGLLLCQYSYEAGTEVPPPTKYKEVNVRLDNLYVADLGQDSYPLPEDANASISCSPLFCNHSSLLPRFQNTIIQNTGGLALTKINIPNKGSINFNVQNGKIDFITVKDIAENTIKKINFDYLQTNNGRRFLKDILVKNRNDVQEYKYSFQYESPENLPPVTWDNYDYWGYFNNKQNTDLVIRGRNIITENKWADKNYVTTGVLKKVVLPTGGFKEFTFESNTYTKELSNPNLIYDAEENRVPQSIHISKPIFNGSIPNSGGMPVQNSLIYVKDFQKINITFSASQFQNIADAKAIFVQLTPVKLTPPSPPLNPTAFPQTEIDNAVVENSSNTQQPRTGVTIKLENNSTSTSKELYGSGYYKVSYHHNGDLQSNSVTYDLDAAYYNLEDNIQYLYGGGLRIKNISINDGATGYFKNYEYGNPSNSKQSSGEIINTPIYTQLHTYNWSQVVGKNLAGFTIAPVSTQYISATELGYSSANAIKGSYVNYKYVKVSDDKGRIENVFSVYSDYPDVTYGDIFYPTYKFHNQDYKVGLPLENKVYAADNTLLKSAASEYEIRNFTSDLKYKVLDKDGGCYLQNGPWSDRVNSYDSYISHLNSQPYPSSLCGSTPMSSLYTLSSFEKYGFGGMKETREKEFFGNTAFETEIDNTYNPRDYLLKKSVKSPEGGIEETTYQYAHEKNSPLMIGKNMIGIPLEAAVTQTTNGTTKTLSKTETVYPDSLPTVQTGNSLLPLSVKSYDNQSNTARTEIVYDRYDSEGNLQQYTTKAGVPVTIVWGYNKTQPIAKIEGAKLSDIQQSLIDNIVSASDTDGSASPNNDEAPLLAALDTFRNNLQNYQISTYTYDPLIGVRSITPPSGVREIYVYDSAGRLKEVRENDVNGNILKDFKYNYKN